MTAKSSTPRTKRPASAAKRERPATKARATSPKGKRSPGRRYSVEERATAVEALERDGMAAVHARTGIPKQTLSRWAKDAGVDLGEQARARTAKATKATVARAAEVRLGTVALLEHHLEQAGSFIATVAGVNAQAAQLVAALDPSRIRVEQGIAGPYAVVEDAEAQAAAKVALALDGLPLAIRDAEGIVTRAIHDLALLKGEATERGELVVNFGSVPRPDPAAAEADVLQLEPAED